MGQRLPPLRQFGLLLLLLVAIATAVFVAMKQVGLPLTGIDDAHIFFVYGQNLASGEGLVYNPGGEQVEGFSSLLWLLIITLGNLVFAEPHYFLLVVSVVLISAAIAVLVLEVDRSKAIGLSGIILIAWIISSPSYVSWMSLAMMDTALWSALLIIGVVFALSGRIGGLTVVATLMVLARPEGMLWVPALILVAALPVWVERGPLAALRAVWPAIVAYLVTLAALTLWRLWTFGYPLPNTYYVKMSPDTFYNLGQGFNYMVAFLYRNPMVLVGVIPAIVALLVNGRWFATAIIRPGSARGDDPRLRYVAVSLIALLAMLVPVYMGGDHFGNFRFYQPVWPLFILPAFALVGVLKVEAPRPVGYALALVMILAAFLLPQANWFNQAYSNSLAHEIAIAQEGQDLGQTMNTLFDDEYPAVGVIRAGAVAGAYQGEVVDLIGLNNTAMAHAPGDRKGLKNHAAFNADVFFSQQPAILLPTLISEEDDLEVIQERLSWDNAVLKGLLADPRFAADYSLVTVSEGEMAILAFVDDAAATQFSAQGLEVDPFEIALFPELGG
jgi:hypothetical protein